GEPLGSADTGFVRFNALIDATDNLQLGVSLSRQEEDVNPVPATLVADDDPRRVGQKQLFRYSPFEFAAGGGMPIGRLYSGAIRNTSDVYWIDPRSYAGDREISRFVFDLDWNLGAVSLISQTAYQDREVATLGDFNTCRADIRAAVCNTVSPTARGTFFGGPLAGSPQIVSVLTGAREDRDELSQDLRLQSNDGGKVQWLAGLYYSTEDFSDETQRLSDGTLTNNDASIVYALADPAPLLDSTTLIENRFLSLYASADFSFSDALSLSLEGRYTREKKEADQVANRFPTNVPPTGPQNETFRFFTPRAILSWEPDDDTLWYVSAAKGVKSGGFNPGSVQIPTFDQEENWSYELGAKYTLLDGRLRLNSAVYFVDWDDQQITGVDPDNSRLPITQNVAKTEIFGFEAEAFYSPNDWLEFNVGVALLDAEYKEGTSVSINFLTDCAALPIPCDESNGIGPYTSGNLDGRKVIGTPDATFNAGVQINRPLQGSGWDLVSRLDYSWQDKVYIDEANAGYLPTRQTVNLRIGVENEQYTLSSFCNNLTDDDTPVFALPPRDILGVPHYFVINRDGRMCGAQFAVRY
ncbi:MAG: TonB-dependent receptor, partial [Gammaproteobacteria bacterium]|nr:TonB-dependent receptor [Gammaproteobacteria bacterium]